VAFYGRGGRVVGVLGMSMPAKVMRWRGLVESGAAWDDALAEAASA
jgi:3-phenylpropionate/trans-cinnamate dioxygenase ferredoxin reductase subunit